MISRHCPCVGVGGGPVRLFIHVAHFHEKQHEISSTLLLETHT
jgi:hypothetical protein